MWLTKKVTKKRAHDIWKLDFFKKPKSIPNNRFTPSTINMYAYFKVLPSTKTKISLTKPLQWRAYPGANQNKLIKHHKHFLCISHQHLKFFHQTTTQKRLKNPSSFQVKSPRTKIIYIYFIEGFNVKSPKQTKETKPAVYWVNTKRVIKYLYKPWRILNEERTDENKLRLQKENKIKTI